MTSVLGVLLAAGAGSRFVGDEHKLAASLGAGDQSVLVTALEGLCAAGFDEVAVVSGAFDVRHLLDDQPDVVIVHNRLWAGGQSTSLRAGVTYAESQGHDAIVVGLADQPFVPASAWQAVANAEGRIVTASFDGRRRPPVKLERSVWDLLPVTGDHGARHLIASRPDLVNEVACEGKPADIDTQEDLRRWN